MAISGAELDVFKQMFTDTFQLELQQKGSKLENTVEQIAVSGETVSFPRKGKAGEATVIDQKFYPIPLEEGSYESRILSGQILFKSETIDRYTMDMMMADPRSAIAADLAKTMGRAKDRIILSALGGSANIKTGGSTSTASFDSNNTIAVDSVANVVSGTPANMLHEGKVQTALKILSENYALEDGEVPVCVASTKQLTYLFKRLQALAQSRMDFVGNLGLIEAKADKRLGGYAGMVFIPSELLTETALKSSSNEYAYFYVPSAVKLGIWDAPSVRMHQLDTMYAGSPWQFVAEGKIGAIRMDEAKVVRALCATTE
jgi:hypothetical protein